MKKSLIFVAVLACAGLFSAAPVFGQKHRVEQVNVTVASDGNKIRGPRSIKPVYVNRIRYRVAVKTKTTFSAGPSLALPFIPQIPGGGGEGGQAAPESIETITNNIDAARKARNPEQEFEEIRKGVQALIRRKADIQNDVSSLLANTKRASDATKDFVLETNALLAGSGGPDAVLGRLQALIDLINGAAGTWPDDQINQFLADVDILENELGRISDLKWLADNKARVDAVKDRLKELRDTVTAWSHNGKSDSPAAQFDQAQRVLQQWKEIFADAQRQGRSYFELPYVDVGCGFAFDQNKETVVTLVKQDRLAEADAAMSEQELVTVVCSSPFSVSGGFGFSTVNEREFVFVPSTKTVTENGQPTQKVINRFGFKNNSSFRPIPLLLLNTRVYEPNDTLAVHLSAGAGVDIKTGEAGSDVEFIVGPSVSFKRSMFVTTGLHVGRVPKLAGGFELGQEVPEGIDQPPVEKAWKSGFIVTITFKLR